MEPGSWRRDRARGIGEDGLVVAGILLVRWPLRRDIGRQRRSACVVEPGLKGSSRAIEVQHDLAVLALRRDTPLQTAAKPDHIAFPQPFAGPREGRPARLRLLAVEIDPDRNVGSSSA